MLESLDITVSIRGNSDNSYIHTTQQKFLSILRMKLFVIVSFYVWTVQFDWTKICICHISLLATFFNKQVQVMPLFFWPGMGLVQPFLVRLGTQILIYFGPFLIIFSVKSTLVIQGWVRPFKTHDLWAKFWLRLRSNSALSINEAAIYQHIIQK